MSIGPGRRQGALAWTREHRRLLVAVVLVSAIVAVPFALDAPNEYQSRAQVLIPASDVVTTSTKQASVMAIRLQEYAQGDLLRDTVVALGEAQASALRSVTAVQLRDQDLYLITADATSPAVVRQAVQAAAAALIDRSRTIASEQVQALQSGAQQRISSLTNGIIALEGQLRQAATRIAAQRQALDQLIGTGHAAQVVTARQELEQSRAEAGELEAQHELLTKRRGALEDLVGSADEDLVKRDSVSSMISGPTSATSTAPTRFFTTIAVAIAIGLLIAVPLMLLFGPRRAPTAGSGSPLAAQRWSSDDGSNVRPPEEAVQPRVIRER